MVGLHLHVGFLEKRDKPGEGGRFLAVPDLFFEGGGQGGAEHKHLALIRNIEKVGAVDKVA